MRLFFSISDFVIVKVGDIVRVHSKSLNSKIGILVKEPRIVKWVGLLADVMIDGTVHRVKPELVESINKNCRYK